MSATSHRRAERVAAALNAFLRAEPAVEAVAVVSYDGLPMVTALPDGLDEDRVAAVSAALLALGEQASQSLGRGGLEQMFLEGADGAIFLMSAGDAGVVVAIADPDAKIGMVLYEMRRAAAEIGHALTRKSPETAAPPSTAQAVHQSVAHRPELGLIHGTDHSDHAEANG